MNSTPYTSTAEPSLYQRRISVKTSTGIVDLNFVYEDTDSEALRLDRGTVLMTHGAPGSHKDFKYITPLLRKLGIRSVAINWPGMGYSSYDNRLENTNEERAQLLQGLLEGLKLDKNLVFLGHSRGCEDALRIGSTNKDKTAAVVLVNPIGFSPHKGVRPFWIVHLLAWIWNLSVYLQPVLAPLYYWLYRILRLKANTGYIAGICLSLMAKTDFHIQKKSIKILNEGNTRALIVYAGKDHLVEPELSHELAFYFHETKQLSCTTTEDDDSIIDAAKKELESGQRHLAAYFEEQDHFLQKHRARFLAETISTILKTGKEELQKKEEDESEL